jgi:hypothetical protein
MGANLISDVHQYNPKEEWPEPGAINELDLDKDQTHVPSTVSLVQGANSNEDSIVKSPFNQWIMAVVTSSCTPATRPLWVARMLESPVFSRHLIDNIPEMYLDALVIDYVNDFVIERVDRLHHETLWVSALECRRVSSASFLAGILGRLHLDACKAVIQVIHRQSTEVFESLLDAICEWWSLEPEATSEARVHAETHMTCCLLIGLDRVSELSQGRTSHLIAGIEADVQAGAIGP